MPLFPRLSPCPLFGGVHFVSICLCCFGAFVVLSFPSLCLIPFFGLCFLTCFIPLFPLFPSLYPFYIFISFFFETVLVYLLSVVSLFGLCFLICACLFSLLSPCFLICTLFPLLFLLLVLLYCLCCALAPSLVSLFPLVPLWLLCPHLSTPLVTTFTVLHP